MSIRDYLLEKKIQDDSGLGSHVSNEVQRAYEILEDVDTFIDKIKSNLPDRNMDRSKTIDKLSMEIKKMMHGLDVSKVIKLADKIARK